MLEHNLENPSQGHMPRLENKGGWEIAIIVRRTVCLSDSSWIREFCRIPNETIVHEKNTMSPLKTKVSLDMAEGDVKGSRSQIIEMTLWSGEEGARAEHVRHHKKTSQKFRQFPRFSE